MTIHVVYDHKCEKCGALYIPYDAGVPCPNCGLVEAERFNYIAEAAASLRFNKEEGSYRPAVWWVGSFGDHILSVLFGLFDEYENTRPENFAAFAAEWLSSKNWGDQQYLQGHILGIAVRLHGVLEGR